MTIRVGCDVVAIPRFTKILLRTPAMRRRIFLPRETKGASIERLAGIFAAKEAVMKATGIPAGKWHDIEISHTRAGRPRVKLSRPSASGYTCDLSIAHDGDYAFAVVVCLIP